MKKQHHNLSDLKPGETAVVESFADDSLSEKFLEMGCIPGEKVTIERVAPLGDPLIIRVCGYLLSLRKSEASAILISKPG